MVTTVVSNFTGFFALGTVFTIMIGVGVAGFFLMKKKKGGNKTAVQFEPEYDDDTEITEESEDDMRFYDNQDDEE